MSVVVRKLGLVFGGLCVGVLCAEALLHVGGVWPEVSWAWQLESRSRVPDRATILINPKFLGDDHYDTGDAERVVVALGDSFTEGYPVGEEAAWPALVEASFASSDKKTRVINMGLGNSGPRQQVRILEDHVLPRLVPDDVVWTFYANDLMDDRVQNTFSVRDGRLVPRDAAEHWIYRRLAAWQAIPLPRSLRNRSAILRNYIQRWENRERPERLADLSVEDDQLELVLDRVVRRANEEGFRLWLVLIKPEAAYAEVVETLGSSNPRLLEYYRLREILNRHRSLFEIDLEEPGQRTSDIFVDSSRDYAASGDHHFNEEGQRRMAMQLADLLR